MNKISELLKTTADDRAIYVFPSEAAAVFWRKSYLDITGKKAVRNDRFLSWDSFKEKITLHDKKDKPVNSVLRRIFTADIIEKNAKKPFLYKIIPSLYADAAGGFADSICRILPEIESLQALINKNKHFLEPGLVDDISEIYERYKDFLDVNSLFEPSWQLPEVEASKLPHYIIAPNLIDDFKEFDKLLSNYGFNLFYPQVDSRLSELRVFENSVIEANAVVTEIKALLKSGTNASSITVTCADDTLARLILSEAKLDDVPISYRKGKSLSEYPAGRLPSLLSECRQSGYSIESLKNLLLFKAFLWKEADLAADLISFGILNRCLKNTSDYGSGDVWKTRLKSAGKIELLKFYEKLKTRIGDLCSCSSFSQLSEKFQVFISTFLITDSSLWDSECERVFQRTREVLSSLCEAEKSISGIEIKNPLALWIKLLGEKIYVKQAEKGGIDLYPYRVSALIEPEVHFVCGLSNSASRAVSLPFAFLSEQQRSSLGISEQNMSDDFIFLYNLSGKDIRFSCSTETPSGAALPPAVFVKDEAVRNINYAHQSEDPFFNEPVLKENIWWQSADSGVVAENFFNITNIQKKGFEYAEKTFFITKEFDATEKVFPGNFKESLLYDKLADEGKIRISASALNKWESCPFSFYATYLLSLFEDEYILKVDDPFTEGDILHEIMFHFFNSLKKEKRAFRAFGKTNEYLQLLEDSANIIFIKWEKSCNYFYGPAWDSFKRKAFNYIADFLKAETETFDGYFPEYLEQWFSFELEEGQVKVVGKIDRISSNENGAVIVDYKRSKTKPGIAKFVKFDDDGNILSPQEGYQIPVYILLAEQNNIKVQSTSYYSFRDGKHMIVSGEKGVLNKIENAEELLCDKTLEEIKLMADSCRKGDFIPPVRCDGCRLRSVCRKRFNVRWAV
ncbi:MAG: PD-(D/E)XK nuclease family protein [Spirochaetales bacterium]|nr:PD-(D/E)XK nuclease family protein [Spirochaetales bacterium]